MGDHFVNLTATGRLVAAGADLDAIATRLLTAVCESDHKAGSLQSLTEKGLSEDEIKAGGHILAARGLATVTPTMGEFFVQLTAKGRLSCKQQ